MDQSTSANTRLTTKGTVTQDISTLVQREAWTEVREFVEAGARVDTPDQRGETPLTIACLKGNSIEAEWLLTHGANPNSNTIRFSRLARFRQQLELFMIFRISCNCPTARFVQVVWNAVRYGWRAPVAPACANSRTGLGRTPLVAASSKGYCDCAELLLNRGAKVNSMSASGDRALIAAARGGHPETVVKLILRGADVNARSISGSTPLIWAARKGFAEVAAVLIHHGARVDGRDLEACTPLIAAAEAGHEDMVKLLLDNGAKVGAHNAARTTALMAGVSAGSKSIVTLLLEHGAPVDDQGKHGITAQEIAMQIGREDLFSLLSKHRANSPSRNS